jgi:hypothetical protein
MKLNTNSNKCAWEKIYQIDIGYDDIINARVILRRKIYYEIRSKVGVEIGYIQDIINNNNGFFMSIM